MAGSDAVLRGTESRKTAYPGARYPEAKIVDIQRMSTEDGPGLRTTVFFKGCNLACPWCHNPETINRKSDLIWFSAKCMGCNICVGVCPQKGISRGEKGIRFNRSICEACGSCAENCPKGAIEMKGMLIPVDRLAGELAKDKAYFGAGGGVTLSGGEALLQEEAAQELARLLKAEGIHTALDTAGCYDFGRLETILPHIDMVLYDIKIFDGDAHKRFTGADNSPILRNYRRLMEMGTRVWVRTPVIEGATDGEENITAIGKFIAASGLPEKWELCAFNNLCRDQYERLDRNWTYGETRLTEKTRIEKLTEIAARYFPGAVYTGAVADNAGG